jgi:hypothetical protein
MRDGPWRLGIVRKVAGIDVIQLLHTRPSRFRRSFLNQESGEQDEHGHLQEFAFPVFKQRLPRMAAVEVFGQREARLTVLLLLRVVLGQAGRHLPDQGNRKHRHQ